MLRKRQVSHRAASALLEQLEERRLLTALVVTDTPNADIITLGVTATGGIKVIFNGKETDYQPNQWDSANINSSAGADTINVQATVVPTIVHYAANNATVNVGDSSGVQHINAALNMNGVAGGPVGNGTAAININDTGDTAPRIISMSTNGQQQLITGLAPAQISIGVVIPPLAPISPGAGVGSETLALTTGASADSLTVSALRSSLDTSLFNAGGNDTLNIGNGSLAQINSPISIWGLIDPNPLAQHSSILNLDDKTDTAPAQFAFSAIYPPGPGAIVYIDFQGTAIPTQRVSFRIAEISSAIINGGSGGNQFIVNALPARNTADGVLTLNTGAGNDAVTLNATAPGTLVNVFNTGGSDAYVVTSIGPFAPTGVNGDLNFDGNAIDNTDPPPTTQASLTIFGPQTNPLDIPAVPVIVTAGLIQHRDQTIHYADINTLQLEHGDFEINQDLGPINLIISSQPSAISFESSTNITFNNTQHLQSLAISAGTVALAAGTNIIVNTNSLAITGGSLDVANNAIQIHYTTTPFATIRKAIFAKQIFTSSADSSHALGYADSADNVVPNLSANTVLITYALKGDANLDKTVGFADLVIVAQHYGQSSNANWDDGDFNQDGAVNFADLVVVAQNYGKSLPPPVTPPAAAMLPSIAAAVAPVTKTVSTSASIKQPIRPRRR